jgi:hypothetical protein
MPIQNQEPIEIEPIELPIEEVLPNSLPAKFVYLNSKLNSISEALSARLDTIEAKIDAIEIETTNTTVLAELTLVKSELTNLGITLTQMNTTIPDSINTLSTSICGTQAEVETLQTIVTPAMTPEEILAAAVTATNLGIIALQEKIIELNTLLSTPISTGVEPTELK